MDRDALLVILNQALTLETRSFARYVVEVALPRIEGPDESRLLDILRDVVADEDRTVSRLLDCIANLDAHPDIGSYEFYIGFYNFLRVDYLAGVAVDRLRTHLERLRVLERKLEGEPVAEGILRDAVYRKEHHLARLAAFRATPEETVTE